MQKPAIRLLASTNNARGDLFTRLVKDLFFALGYDDLRLDVAKSGREIDLQGSHRFETREVIAECKAEEERIGGRDANTFLGVLTRERDQKPGTEITGYFVSLNGFRESEVEQELRTSTKNRIILLTGEDVVEELQRSHVLVSRDQAVERAGRCAAAAGIEAELDGTELLGHQLGYVWAVYYARGKQRTHVTLIHADGTPLADAVAQQVMLADGDARVSQQSLKYIGGPHATPEHVEIAKSATERYLRWIEAECGFIQLDGLPADTDLSATRMKLERLFVPLKVAIPSQNEERVLPLGDLLASDIHLALVAKPGGGKSTLLKRLAIAYAFPSRRAESDDKLPDHDWLPLFLRCRELRDRVQRPILELLDDLPRYAGMNQDEARLFREKIHDALQSGKALLLVDGLDEISDEGARQTFAQHLRTFVAIFPNAAVVVTSREAGFRLIAGVIASTCIQAKVASFDEEDVASLCERWHVEVVADNEKVRSDARELAQTIWTNERIRALAENPLMLTTLLVVRRYIGELPNRRVELYGEAVKVLIRTWNTEGFAPLNLEEALAQLSYVACSMTQSGIQQIALKPLLKLLRQAREDLAAELHLTKISSEEFIERIEYRSSLLMQVGHSRVDGELQELYEFRHLTFQEYLTARGLVEEQYHGRDEGRKLVDLLEPHFNEEKWQEIVPLVAVLAGRKAESVVQRLIAASERISISGSRKSFEPLATPSAMLRQCLLDEVQVGPAVLRAALDRTARDKGVLRQLYGGKFGALLAEIVQDGYLGGGNQWQEYFHAIVTKYEPDQVQQLSDDAAKRLLGFLKSEKRTEQVRGAVLCRDYAFNAGFGQGAWATAETRRVRDDDFLPLRDAVALLLRDDDPPVTLVALGALMWMARTRSPNSPPVPHLLRSLYRLFRSQSGLTESTGEWAFSAQPLLPRETFTDVDFPDAESLFDDSSRKLDDVKNVLAWYRIGPWTDSDLIENLGKGSYPDITALEILRELGKPAEATLNGLLLNSDSSSGIEIYHQLYGSGPGA